MARCRAWGGIRSGVCSPCVAPEATPAACLRGTPAFEPPGSTPGPDHLPEACQCGGDGGGVGPGLRGGPAWVGSVGPSGGGPGRGRDPHLPASPGIAAGPTAAEEITASHQEEKIFGVIEEACAIEQGIQVGCVDSITDRDQVARATVSSFN